MRDAHQYKDTLHLPQTDFPMRAGLPQKEPTILEFWQSLQLYRRLAETRQDQAIFILHDGPPYANGAIHMGHAVNKILKDAICKTNSLLGKQIHFVPGWDCHGLPIEIQVESKFGKVGKKLDAKAFRQAARDYAQTQIDLQTTDFKRLGVLADFEHPYRTSDPQTEANTLRVLGTLLEKGLVHRGHKPTYFCFDCQSALAEAEITYKNKQSNAVEVGFSLCDLDKVHNAFGLEASSPNQDAIDALIWTTTPWTLPANQGIAIAPALNYQWIKTDRGQLLIAESRAEAILSPLDCWDNHEVIATCQGEALIGLRILHPLSGQIYQIWAGNHVGDDMGTGMVHIAGAHGLDDFALVKHEGLKPNIVLDRYALYLESLGEPLAGISVSKADPLVMELLAQKNALWGSRTLEHSYPHCWRHQKPVIMRGTAQFFIDLTELAPQAAQAFQSVSSDPNWAKAHLTSMVEKRVDWCISRQRTWGVPLALVVHRESGDWHPRIAEVIKEAAKRIEQEGSEAWYQMDVAGFLGEDLSDYDIITDVLDVWFDSGVSHTSVLADRLAEIKTDRKRADLVWEGSDQHRGWFQSSLLTACALYEEAPYHRLWTHGFVVDEKGHKMSKSQGNIIAPQTIITQYGADVCRLWALNLDSTKEMSISASSMKQTAECYRRLRNTLRYLLASLNDFNPKTDSIAPEEMLALDQTILKEAEVLQESLKEHWEKGHFALGVQQLLLFCTDNLGCFYFDIIKDRLYTLKVNARARRSAQSALYHLAHAFARFCMPIISFTAEEFWQQLRRIDGFDTDPLTLAQQCDQAEKTGTDADKLAALEASVLALTFYSFPVFESNHPFDFEALLPIKEAINLSIEKAREAKLLGAGTEAFIKLSAPETSLKQIRLLGEEVRFLFGIAGIELIASETCSAVASKSDWVKCARCWYHDPSVPTEEDAEPLCTRCSQNLDPDSEEVRFYL